jgi:hypothetical protein
MFRPLRGANDGPKAAFRRGHCEAVARDRGTSGVGQRRFNGLPGGGDRRRAYYAWRKKIGGMGQPQLSELKARQLSS